MDEISGATAFVPGSHLVDDAEAAAAGAARRLADAQACRIRVVRCAPGDLVVIHPKVVYGGGGNHSARWRRNVILQVGDADEPLTVAIHRESTTGVRIDTPAGSPESAKPSDHPWSRSPSPGTPTSG